MFSGLLKEYWADNSVSSFAGLGTLTLLLAVSGPFGTYERLGFPARLMLWSGTVMMAIGTAAVAHRVSGWAARRRGWGRLPREGLRLLLVILLFSPLAYATVKTIGGSETAWRLAGLLKSAAYVAGIAIGVRLLNAGAAPLGKSAPDAAPDAGAQDDAGPPEAAAPEEEEPRLARRFPEGFSGPVLRLNGKDHFVEVVSPSASFALRMRLSDAIAEMEPVEGVVPHRSHWVRKDAIARSTRSNGRVELELVNGDKVPVSRGAQPQLKSLGVI